MTLTSTRPNPLALALPAAFALALLPAAWSVTTAGDRAAAPAPRFADAQGAALAIPPGVPPPPPVEPLELKPVAPTDAVAINAAVPFSTAPNPAARPFRVGGPDLARSVDCLAAAALYEGGDNTDWQRSVVQVVINRLRHPAFPKTVCGVVFAGQERRTGCQFTFTCDGSLARRWSDAAWGRARDVARAALTGRVDKRVGHATHYHTDWVVPYWSASLDKITAVGPHLFFRWTGWWGTPGAFRFGHAGGEPRIARLAALSPAHAGAPGEDDALLAASDFENIEPAKPRETMSDGGSTFVVRVKKSADADRVAALAMEACGTRDYCKFMAWADKDDMPAVFPISQAQLDTMAFSYLRNRKAGFEKPLWNCTRYQRADIRQCMKTRTVVAAVEEKKEPGPVRMRIRLREPEEREPREESTERAAVRLDTDSTRRRPGS